MPAFMIVYKACCASSDPVTATGQGLLSDQSYFAPRQAGIGVLWHTVSALHSRATCHSLVAIKLFYWLVNRLVLCWSIGRWVRARRGDTGGLLAWLGSALSRDLVLAYGQVGSLE